MTKKRFDEYFAKVVLESCFPKRFTDLQVSDKPDLRCGNAIGIEVTNCMPKEAAEAFTLWHRVEKQGEQTSPRILERLEQLKDTVHLVGNDLIWEQGAYINNDIDNSPIKEFTKAVAKKVERLNSTNACYVKMDSYELFVNSFILIPHYQISAVLEQLKSINNKTLKFDTIYLITNEQKLLIFDMTSGTLQIKYLYSHLDRMEEKAIELCKGTRK